MTPITSQASLRPDTPTYFEALFQENSDPWKFRTRWYERRKRGLTMACLPTERYAYGYEPACANGELSAALATRCDRLLATDGTPLAVDLARERLQQLVNVDVALAWVPDDWPDQKFDLIVLSEFLYYLRAEAVAAVGERVLASLQPGGVVLACHWRHPIDGCVLSGDAAHDLLGRLMPMPNVCQIHEPDLRIDVWTSGATAARRDGLV